MPAPRLQEYVMRLVLHQGAVTHHPIRFQLHHLPGTSAAPLNEHDAAMARQFFEGGGQGPGPMMAIPPMELQRMVEATGMQPQELREAWAMERQLPQESLDWSSEYSAMGKAPMPMQQNMTALNDGTHTSVIVLR